VRERGYEHFHPDVDFFYAPGGGPALDLGPYYVTALVAMLGPVARVSGFARASFPERAVLAGPRAGDRIPVHVPTHVTGALEFESGALATVMMSWDVWATRLPYLEVYGADGSLSAGNPDLFDAAPRVRRFGAEELSESPPAPGVVPWATPPLTHAADVGRGIGIADMAHAIRSGRPHRADAQLACHVLEVLSALQGAPATGAVEIESSAQRPAPLPLGLLPGRLD
jgi:predicted dehydrogenase